MREKKLTGNLMLSTIYQILTLVIPMVTAPYAARVLGVDGTGIYSYTHSYVMYFMLFGALGMVSYGTREIAQHRNSVTERSRIFWEIAFLTIFTTSASIFAWIIWILFNQDYRTYYIILTMNLLGTMFDISWFYAGMEEFKYTVTQNSLFKIIGAVSIFLFVKKQEDLWVYILILSLSTFLANITMWVYLPKYIKRVPLNSLRFKRHFKETLVYFVPTIATSIYTILDKTLIGLITKETSENGYYEQATKVINMAKSLCFAGVNSVLSSRISYLFSQKKYQEIKDRIAVSMEFILSVGVAICFGLIGVSERFVPFFFGPGYENTIFLLQFMSPLIVIIGISNCLGSQYYTPAGLRSKSAKFIIAGSVINLILNLLLIPKLKSSGAVIATIVAELTITGLYLYYCDGYYSFVRLLSQIWKKLIAGVIMLVSVFFIGRIISNAFISIICQVFIGGIEYVSILYILRDDFMTRLLIPKILILYERLKMNRR